jgi:CRP-like cAMP-binding protein
MEVPGFWEAMGYVASILVFATFYVRTMVPLRVIAIASNVAFLAYAIPLALWPVALLHALLLPLNLLRLLQIRRMIAAVHAARAGEFDIGNLLAALAPQNHSGGTVLFRKGDTADCAYYVASGEIEFPERHEHAGPGDIFGEVGIFSEGRQRTASAVCKTDAQLYRIDDHDIVLAFHQNPAFAFALVRLITQRMVSNVSRLETKLAELASAR